MKKILLTLLALFAPFLLMWSCWLVTAGSFNIHSAFTNSAFWVFVIVYWLFFVSFIIIIIWE